jgi:hypothetical protein
MINWIVEFPRTNLSKQANNVSWIKTPSDKKELSHYGSFVAIRKISYRHNTDGSILFVMNSKI